MSKQNEVLKKYIQDLMADIKSSARQVKFIMIINKYLTEHDLEHLPFDAFFEWLRTSSFQIGMLVSQVYKFAKRNECRKHLREKLDKAFKPDEQEKILLWSDIDAKLKQIEGLYFEKFRIVRNKLISHADYELGEAEKDLVTFNVAYLYADFASIHQSLSRMLHIISNPRLLNEENPFFQVRAKSPIVEFDEYFHDDPATQDFCKLLDFCLEKNERVFNAKTPYLYRCQ